MVELLLVVADTNLQPLLEWVNCKRYSVGMQ